MFRAVSVRHQEGQIVLIHFGPPDDEQLLLETHRGINKYIKRECIKLVITQNCIEMHGQKNIKNSTNVHFQNKFCVGLYPFFLFWLVSGELSGECISFL
jgi:hypothetical protein